MAFWNTPSNNESQPAQPHLDAQLNTAQQALMQSRRRLLGATVLLALACGLIPWMLDSTPRSWGEDVVLRMPQIDKPYQAKLEGAGDPKNGANTDAKGGASTEKTVKP